MHTFEKFNGLMDPYEAKALTVVIVSHFIECMKKKEENKRVISPAVSFMPLYGDPLQCAYRPRDRSNSLPTVG